MFSWCIYDTKLINIGAILIVKEEEISQNSVYSADKVYMEKSNGRVQNIKG
jgi:hypothetical protein